MNNKNIIIIIYEAIKLILLQSLIEDIVNPIWFKLVKWYEKELNKCTKFWSCK